MMKSFHTAFRSSRRGTMHSESIVDTLADTPDRPASSKRSHKEQRDLPKDLYHRLLDFINRSSPTPFESFYRGVIGGPNYLSPTAEYARNVEQSDGVTYACSSGGKRDSFVLFSKLVNGTPLRFAGQISQIFYHTRRIGADTIVEPFFLVHQFEPLSPAHAAHDPYRKYPDVPTWMCYNRFTKDTHLLRLEDIVCHFAALEYTPEEIGQECIVVRSLDRVSFILLVVSEVC